LMMIIVALKVKDRCDESHATYSMCFICSICSMENTQGNKRQDESIGPLLFLV
jgi:hypothetical protein